VLAVTYEPEDRHVAKNWEDLLTLEGNIVLPCVMLTDAEVAAAGLSATDVGNLEDIQLRKVDMADTLMVVDTNGLVSERMRKEIIYAESKGKEVQFLSELIQIRKARAH
jgi:hypothetical protein